MPAADRHRAMRPIVVRIAARMYVLAMSSYSTYDIDATL
jgi:hypothetical protein